MAADLESSRQHRHHWHDETPEWAKHELEALQRHIDRQFSHVMALLEKLAHGLLPGPAVSGTLAFTTTEGVHVSDLSILDSDTTPKNVSASFKDAAGQGAKLDDVPTWSSSDETVATVQASDDGLSAVVTPLGVEGATLIKAETVDQDGTAVDASGTLTVTGGEAVSGDLTFTDAPAA